MKKIALISPSSPTQALTPETLAQLKDIFDRMGYHLHLGSHALDAVRHLAGTDADRAADVMRAFTDDEIDVVMSVRGGSGSPRILDLLDYNLLSRHKKPFLTLSDGTALQTALYTKAGHSGYSGIIGLNFLEPENQALVAEAARLLNGEKPHIPIKKILRPGRTEGICIGGNLSVLTGLIGTPYLPDMTGKILLIEDVNEYPYRLERLLAQWRLGGLLDQVAGVILGTFGDQTDRYGGTSQDVLNDYFGTFDRPVVQVDYGHGPHTVLMPIGRTIRLDTQRPLIEEVE
jgi:muramoyltetrapeptide carboxypeptidase